jgi:hypothetical protein
MEYYKEIQVPKICVENTVNIPIDKIYSIKKSNPKTQLYYKKNIDNHKGGLQSINKLKAAFVTNKLWKSDPDNPITIKIYFYEEGIDDVKRTSLQEIENTIKGNKKLKMDPLQLTIDNLSVKEAIKKIVTERIQPLVNLKFQFVDNIKNSDIRISFKGEEGAWSLVGTDACLDKNSASMNLGWFDVATTMHEFGHALGMIHEHQNPLGKNGIIWNEKKVYQWARSTQGWDKDTTYQNIIEKYDINTLNGSTFDPDSIMLYFFPGDMTCSDKSCNKSGKGTSENLRLSKNDVIFINKNYPIKNKPKAASEFYKNVYKETISDEEESTPGIFQSTTPGIFQSKTPNALQTTRNVIKPYPKNFLTSKKSNIFRNIIIILVILIIIFLIYKFV